MFKKMFLAISLLLLSLVLVSAQDGFTYISHDAAVQFDVPDGWDLEMQNVVFNQEYYYMLWSPARNVMSLYTGAEGHSRIIIEFQRNFPDDGLETLEDFAQETLTNTNFIDSTEIEILGYPGIVQNLEMIGVEDHVMSMYTAIRDDGWVFLASVISPVESQEIDLETIENIFDSIQFDAELAETPFIRNIPEYDYSEAELTQSHTNEQGLLTVDYPANWDITRSEAFFSTPPAFYIVEFELPDDEMRAIAYVFDSTTEHLGLSLNENTSYEYMYHQRNLTGVDLREYRLGEFDTLLVDSDEENILSLYYALNHIWIAQGAIIGGTDESRRGYEAELMAVMASLEFGLQQSYISAPSFYVDFSDEWVYAVNNQEDPSYTQYILRPAGHLNPSGPRIIIEFIYIESQDNVLLEDIPSLINVEIINSELLTIGENETYRFDVRQSENPQFGRWTAFYVGEEWLMIVSSLAGSEPAFEYTLDVADSIIENVEFTLDDE